VKGARDVKEAGKKDQEHDESEGELHERLAALGFAGAIPPAVSNSRSHPPLLSEREA
jgi:hypothetical protein